MKLGNFNINISDKDLDITISNLYELYRNFILLIEDRNYTDLLMKIISTLYKFKGEPVGRLTDSQIEEQIIICSQHRDTVVHLAREIKYHINYLENQYNIWYAKKYNIEHNKLLKEQLDEVKNGVRTKGGYGNITKDDIKMSIMINHTFEFNLWFNYINDIKNTHEFLTDISDGLKDRNISLQSVNKSRNNS